MTAKNTHTPGPWSYVKEGNNIVIGKNNPEWNPDIIALIIAKTVGNSEMCQANARLIASAPDLLEACKEMAQWIADETDGALEGLPHWLRVIAKAEGK